MYVTKDINKVILGGTVVDAPSLRETGNRTKVTNFTLKTVSEFSNGDETAKFHKVIGWGQVAEEIVESIHIGQRITVEGELTYHKDRNDNLAAEIKTYRIFMN